MKNKTIAVWLTLLTGPIGLSRIYMAGRFDRMAWGSLLPTLIGAYGVLRARELGLDDHISWILIPWIGLSATVTSLIAIVYGLMEPEKWNTRFNPELTADHPAGQSGWFTIAGVVVALLLGATVLLSSLAFSFQRYFEYQAEDSGKTAMVTHVRMPKG